LSSEKDNYRLAGEKLTIKLQQMLFPVYNFPLLFMEQYIRNEKGLLTKHTSGGTLMTTPLIISNNYIDQTVDLAMSNNIFYLKIGKQNWEPQRGKLQIPTNSAIINMIEVINDRKLAEKSRFYHKKEISRGENIVFLYIGKAACEYTTKILEAIAK